MMKFEKSTRSDMIYALGILTIFLSMIFLPIFLGITEWDGIERIIEGLFGLLIAWILVGWGVKGLMKKKTKNPSTSLLRRTVAVSIPIE